MPISNILKIEPFSRIHDLFVRDSSIDASEVLTDVKHPVVKFLPNSKETRFQVNFYQQIAVDVVVETVFDYPYPYISEKSLRAFACKRMIIVLGPMGVLSTLKTNGFKTFDDFINESYDQIPNPLDRFNAVTTEIHKLCARPLEEITEYLENNKEKINHNFNNLLTLQEKELQKIKKQISMIGHTDDNH